MPLDGETGQGSLGRIVYRPNRSRAPQFRDDPTAIGNQHWLAILDFPKYPAQVGLQLADADSSHGLNVVT
jgi:hypothetical protein